MLTLLASLLIAQAQPAPPIDWETRPRSATTDLVADYAKAVEERQKTDDAKKGRLGFKVAPPPQTEEERIAAANAAAIARAEQAGQEANTTTPWPDDGKMRCKPTESGFVCGNSEKALEPDSPSRQALDNLLKPD